MTKITAKVLVASSDKTYMLPAADDPKPASNQPLQASAPELRRVPLPRLSEKGKRSLPCSLTEHQNGTFRPIFASQQVQIRAQSVVRTPFRTVSPGTPVNRRKRLQRDFSVCLERPLTSAPPMIRSRLQRKNAIGRSRGLEARPRVMGAH
jgi:hypothetical protein